MFVQSRVQRKESSYLNAKLAFHAKESPIRTREEVFCLVSSRPISPADDDILTDDSSADDGSPAIRTPPNPGLPHPLTKPLSRAKHDQHQDSMGVRIITM